MNIITVQRRGRSGCHARSRRAASPAGVTSPRDQAASIGASLVGSWSFFGQGLVELGELLRFRHLVEQANLPFEPFELADRHVPRMGRFGKDGLRPAPAGDAEPLGAEHGEGHRDEPGLEAVERGGRQAEGRRARGEGLVLRAGQRSESLR